ncbi:MAG: hypothetical protein CM15mP74_08900 [Halieaceae bacterium]|nr:MAG: hypothetical protein CM15mP74_08900 [Halieaceae bacterium]
MEQYHHLEAYLAIPSMGCVLHTLNCRLSPEHIAYIIGHAGDRLVIVDGRLVDTFLDVVPLVPDVEHFIVLGTDEQCERLKDPRALRYEDLASDAGFILTGLSPAKMQPRNLLYERYDR